MSVAKFAVLAMIVLGVCQTVSGDVRQPLSEGEAIRMCRDAYAETTGSPISDEIDRAYVYSRWDVSWVHFTRGELGSFGEPDPHYAPWLSCTVATQPREVQELWMGWNRYLDKEPKTYEDFHHPDEEFMESLYLRDDDRFIHVETRPYSDEWMELLDQENKDPSEVPEFYEIN